MGGVLNCCMYDKLESWDTLSQGGGKQSRDHSFAGTDNITQYASTVENSPVDVSRKVGITMRAQEYKLATRDMRSQQTMTQLMVSSDDIQSNSCSLSSDFFDNFSCKSIDNNHLSSIYYSERCTQSEELIEKYREPLSPEPKNMKWSLRKPEP